MLHMEVLKVAAQNIQLWHQQLCRDIHCKPGDQVVLVSLEIELVGVVVQSCVVAVDMPDTRATAQRHTRSWLHTWTRATISVQSPARRLPYAAT